MKDAIRLLLPNGRYRPPATEQQLRAVEAELRVAIPSPLRELYLAFDGLREPIGNSAYLLPLTECDGASSLLDSTRFFWTEWKQFFPDLDLTPFLFFGLTGGDDNLGIALAPPHEIIVYHHSMGGDFQRAGADLLQVYRQDHERMLEL